MDPTYIVFVGGLLGLIGAFWLQRSQNKESKQMHEQLIAKNDKLSHENKQAYKQLAEKTDEYAKKQERASEEVRELQQKLIEKSDVNIQKTEDIAKLNAELAESQKEIAKLSIETNNNVTGGNSFCYVTLSPSNDNKIKIDIFHRGEYTLHNLKMYITNVSAMDRLIGNNGPVRKAIERDVGRFRHRNAIVMEIGNLSPSPSQLPKGLGELSGNSVNDWTVNDSYYIEFFVDNRRWQQSYSYTNNAGSMHRSIMVKKDDKVIFEQ